MQSQPHILFVDDDPDTCELVSRLLSDAGFCVSIADQSSAVLEMVRQQSFDVLLLDNWMPEITGIDLCRQIREFDKTIPILFCSGTETQSEMDAAISAGAQAYIVKPLDPDSLIQNLRSM